MSKQKKSEKDFTDVEKHDSTRTPGKIGAMVTRTEERKRANRLDNEMRAAANLRLRMMGKLTPHELKKAARAERRRQEHLALPECPRFPLACVTCGRG